MAKTPSRPTSPAPLRDPPWERQPGEPDRAFAAFCLYRDAGAADRSLDGVGRQVHGTRAGRKRGATGRVQHWSARWSWVARARAYDAHQDRLAREAREEAVRKVEEKHVLQLKHLFNQVIKAGQKADFERMSIEQIFRWSERLIIMERLVHGQPVTIEQVRHAGPEGGVMRSVQAHAVATPADPDPASIAQVMQILIASGVPCEDAPAPDPAGPDENKAGG
jgi:hypothetical protein